MGCFGRLDDNDYEDPRLMLMKYIYDKRIQRGAPLSQGQDLRLEMGGLIQVIP